MSRGTSQNDMNVEILIEDPYTNLQISEVASLRVALAEGRANVTVVEPLRSYQEDTRRFLGILGFPPSNVIDAIHVIQESLRIADPEQFYISPGALHLTIKNIRTIADPPNFTAEELTKVDELLASVTANRNPIPLHGRGFLLMPTSLSIPVYSNRLFGELVTELDAEMRRAGVPDNKSYSSSSVFFTNITIARFLKTPTPEFMRAVQQMSDIELPPFLLSHLELVCSNLAFSAGQVSRYSVHGLAIPSM